MGPLIWLMTSVASPAGDVQWHPLSTLELAPHGLLAEVDVHNLVVDGLLLDPLADILIMSEKRLYTYGDPLVRAIEDLSDRTLHDPAPLPGLIDDLGFNDVHLLAVQASRRLSEVSRAIGSKPPIAPQGSRFPSQPASSPNGLRTNRPRPMPRAGHDGHRRRSMPVPRRRLAPEAKLDRDVSSFLELLSISTARAFTNAVIAPRAAHAWSPRLMAHATFPSGLRLGAEGAETRRAQGHPRKHTGRAQGLARPRD